MVIRGESILNCKMGTLSLKYINLSIEDNLRCCILETHDLGKFVVDCMVRRIVTYHWGHHVHIKVVFVRLSN